MILDEHGIVCAQRSIMIGGQHQPPCPQWDNVPSSSPLPSPGFWRPFPIASVPPSLPALQPVMTAKDSDINVYVETVPAGPYYHVYMSCLFLCEICIAFAHVVQQILALYAC